MDASFNHNRQENVPRIGVWGTPFARCKTPKGKSMHRQSFSTRHGNPVQLCDGRKGTTETSKFKDYFSPSRTPANHTVCQDFAAQKRTRWSQDNNLAMGVNKNLAGIICGKTGGYRGFV
jgi:hypothetical protein